MADKFKTVILGAGIAGLSAAYNHSKYDSDFAIYEAEDKPGGLLGDFIVNGFRFDQAIHLSFANEVEVRNVFDKTKSIKHSPEAWCWHDDKWIKHPAHNNLMSLPLKEKIDLISSFVNKKTIEIKTYEDWLLNQYGSLISKKWTLPYTEKYWTLPAKALGTKWIGERVKKANINEILHGAFTDKTPTYYYASEMRYPKNGGYKAFLDPLIENQKILINHRAININPIKKEITFENNSLVNYDYLINTMPLPKLISIMENVPADILQQSKQLHATSIDLLSVGFDNPQVQDKLWFYIYDKDIFAARCHSPSIKSKNNVPSGKSSLQFEVYSSKFKPQNKSVEELKENIEYALMKMKIINDVNEILFIHHRHVPYANVIFDINMEEKRDNILSWLTSVGVLPAGRFGEWDYLWSNQAFMSGKAASDKILNNN